MDNSVSEPTYLDQAITHLAQAISSLERVERINRRLTDDAKDAARYRWLRDNCKDVDLRAAFGFIAWGRGSLDVAIDKEIENAKTRE